MKVDLTKEDIELIIEALSSIGQGHGFILQAGSTPVQQTAITQRIGQIINKLKEQD